MGVLCEPLRFTSDLTNYLVQSGYRVEDFLDNNGNLLYQNVFIPNDGWSPVAEIWGDNFESFLKSRNVYWGSMTSALYLPTDSIYVNNTFYIIDNSLQYLYQPNLYRPIDIQAFEHLLICDFYKKQYEKLLSPLNIKVEYIYLLDTFFQRTDLRDVFEYIRSVDCKYYFESIPPQDLGLPIIIPILN